MPEKHRSTEANEVRTAGSVVSRNPCILKIDASWLARLVRLDKLNPLGALQLFGVTLVVNPALDEVDVGKVFPAWVPVEGEDPVVLEGVVLGTDKEETEAGEEGFSSAHVSFEDFPLNHFTHDGFGICSGMPDARPTRPYRIVTKPARAGRTRGSPGSGPRCSTSTQPSTAPIPSRDTWLQLPDRIAK